MNRITSYNVCYTKLLRIFPQSGGVPVAKRAPQRQAYRLVERGRWSAQLGIPINVQPRHVPVDATPAACLILGAPETARFALAGALLAAVWRDQKRNNFV